MGYFEEKDRKWAEVRERDATRVRAYLLRRIRTGKPVYEITGTWSGYTSAQSKVCHREYTTNEERAEWCRSQFAIHYSDGTSLYLEVKDITDKSQIQQGVDGYTSLIYDCVR